MLPLDDLLVFDLSRVLSGPYCSMHLADFGARVVKLEKPGEGDDTRAFGPPFLSGESTYFLSVNRNKESVAVDLKKPEGREIALKIAGKADVLLENFRPGALDRLGLDYESLRKANPRLIYASISGFGHTGRPEWVQRPGYDLVVQGLGGLASLNGEPDRMPLKCGVSIADMVAGFYALIGVLVALHARARTGRGQHVDVSMLDGQIALLTYHAGIHFATGRNPSRMGNRHPSITPYETYRAADGHVNIACGNDSLFRAFARILERPELATDARYATNAARVENREALYALLEPLVAARPLAWWLAQLDAAGIPCGPIHTVADALAHPQVLARDMVVPLDHPTAGPIKVTGVPVRLSETPGRVRTPPPRLGEHTRALLGELAGLDGAALDRLTRSGVIG
jgi:crotonobetainyl-CoA:carnitine CoA-transferase CaiB-like acyl-CoA transferase